MRPVAWALRRGGLSGSVTFRTWFGKCSFNDKTMSSMQRLNKTTVSPSIKVLYGIEVPFPYSFLQARFPEKEPGFFYALIFSIQWDEMC